MSDCAPKREVPLLWPCHEDYVRPEDTRECPGPEPSKILEAYPNHFDTTPRTVEDLEPLNTDTEGNIIPDEGGSGGGSGGGGGGGGDGGGGVVIITIPGILVEDGTYLSTQSLVFLIRQDA